MTVQERRGGGRRSKAGRSSGGIPQLPWQRVANPYQPMQLLNEEQMDKLHRTSMRILSELGIQVMGEKVMRIFEAAGAIVDRSASTVRIDESIVAEAVRRAPSSFTITSRNPQKEIKIGGNALVFGLVAGPPNVHDRVNGRRQGNLPDYENFIRLAHHFNAIHIIGNQVVAPMELPPNNRHLDTYRANLTLSDLSFHCSAIGRGRAMDSINMTAIARGISVDALRASPGVTTII
jgi:trimethylamine--corrinoid protein Co-methyltransferase